MNEEFPQILQFILHQRGGSLPTELLWFLGVIGSTVLVLLLLRLSNWRLRRSFEAVARLEALTISLEATGPVLVVYYDFRYRGQSYPGAGVVPLSAFIGPDTRVWLGCHDWLDLPVLNVNDEVYVGEEAIEHTLFQMRSAIRIRFLSGDPSRNSPVGEPLLSEHNEPLTS